MAPESNYRFGHQLGFASNTPEDDRGFQIALAKLLDKRLLRSATPVITITAGDRGDLLNDQRCQTRWAAKDAHPGSSLMTPDCLCQPTARSLKTFGTTPGLAQKDHVRSVLSSRRRLRECIPEPTLHPRTFQTSLKTSSPNHSVPVTT